MDFITSRFDILNSFERSMRMLLRHHTLGTNKQAFHRDMLIIIKYVSSIKEGVFLAQEIKTSFEFFLPKLENEWKECVYSPLIKATERYTESLTQHLHKQNELFEQVSLIISSLDMAEDFGNIKATIKSTLIPITIEFRIIKILCQIHNLLFKKDQEKLNQAIEEFLLEFNNLEEISTQPLVQLRGLIEQIRVVSEMPTEAELVKTMLEKVIHIAHKFIHSFCGE
jgi:hypothetical protein